ncbi:MAG: orotate phosphoribosyltransferase [Trichodesmium sp. St15_bin1_1]|jgi:orotate phosphoribosyltransferase|nr:orotate phosphoribosyltransferase [Trichodesmium sp. MAG_R02]MDE5080980.1 orotate phosphoribosyltransferase [Trichodesmium sp. St18_bin1]MDE5088760.1 orotate phosphoribosyltransferase [Trichodesmium sp. St16_bin2-tuft]MDE5110655.1 orotate phosphoribosyltransferase [Trichodesmium sp. St7_bin2_1]MDE5114651.1 orotate phosphoribosyltransferase [Trichodesmium sp. St15_bin1_1]MDE5123169.1 orotate phosphoribosyltransferase [Trichodesmium sp. St19_bin1]
MTNQIKSLNSSSLATTDLTTIKQQLLNLLCTLAYQEGDFVLSSGQSSSYYINGKYVTLHPLGALIIGRLLLSMLPEDTQGVAGLTLGADPLVTAVSVVSAYENRPIPALIIRKQAKGHGTMSYIEGPTLNANAKVVILEDVVTTGASAMMAVNRLREVGYHVNHIFSLVDRQQGGREFYDREGIQFESIFTISDLQENMKNINHKNND